MELRHLKYFVKVAEELNFGRAAEQLYLTQPALSKQIRCLEDELGVLLFHRTKNHRIQLTLAGQELLKEARDILLKAEMAIQTTRRLARGETGILKLGFTGTALHKILPVVIKEFSNHYPNVELDLTEMCTLSQVRALQEDEIDIGFIHTPIDNDFDLHVHPIMEESLIVALPIGDHLSRNDKIALKQLADRSFILHPRNEGPVIYSQIINLCNQAGFQPKVVQEVLMSQTRVGLVAAGMGITFVPESFKKNINSGVAYIDLEEPSPKLRLAAAWRSSNQSSVLKNFIKITRGAT